MGSAAAVGIDIGTSGSKGILVDAEGRILSTAIRQHSVERPRPGWFEIDAAQLWDEFVSLTGELMAAARSVGVDVGGVGVSGMGPCVLVTDAASTPLRPVILYGVDMRAVAEIDELERRFGADEIVARCGSALSTQAVGPKLLWLEHHEPDAWGRARRVFTVHSWIASRLTGTYALDHHSASQFVPLYDLSAEGWHAPWFTAIAPQLEPPQLFWPGEIIGGVEAFAAAETGLPAGVPVIAGTIDAWAEAISVGAHKPGDLMLMYGTTMFLISTVAEITRAPGLWTTNGGFAGTRSLAGGMATSGAITSWLSEIFGVSDFGTLVDLARLSPPGANGLLMLPYFAGERTPFADPRARGVLAGLTLDSTRGDIYRAALEATALGARHNVESLRDAGVPIDRVIAVGGGVTGRLWTQIVSDVTGLEQHITEKSVGAAFGDAVLAIEAITGMPAELDSWNPDIEIVRPDTRNAASYDELYTLYRELYTSTAPIAHALAQRQEELIPGRTTGSETEGTD